MNYILYGKHKDDRRYGAINIRDGSIGVGLVFASLIHDLDKAKTCADKYAEACPDFSFQVRVAGKSKVVYQGQRVEASQTAS